MGCCSSKKPSSSGLDTAGGKSDAKSNKPIKSSDEFKSTPKPPTIDTKNGTL